MKRTINLVLTLMFCLSAFGQQSYLQRVPVFPTTVDRNAVDNFKSKLNSLKEEIKSLTAKYEAENQAAASKIDPAAIAAAYSKNMDVNAIMNRQKKTEEMQENQNKMTNMLERYQAYSDSIKSIFEKDFDGFMEKYNAYMSKCSGEGGSEATCNSLKNEMNANGKKLLIKYWFDAKSAEYVKFIISLKADLQPLHLLFSSQVMEVNEEAALIKFPHKENLGYLKFTLDYISFIENAWSFDSRLWPK